MPDDAYPELDPDRFDEQELDRRRADLDELDDLLGASELTEEDIEALDAIVKEGIREAHVEKRTGETKRGMDEI